MIPSAAPAADGVDEVEVPSTSPSANQGQGFDGRHSSAPAPTSQEDHSQAAHAVAATIPRSPSSTGGSGLSFQMTRPSRPRGLNRRWCVPCNGMRDHLYSTCLMDWWHR